MASAASAALCSCASGVFGSAATLKPQQPRHTSCFLFPNPHNRHLTTSVKANADSSSSAAAAANDSPFDLVPPPIDHDFLETMADDGAVAFKDGSVETFGNDDLALEAADDGVVVVDLSHFGRIRVTGEDRIQFLHNQSTANFECLHDGQGCDTVFVTPTARTIDIAYTWIMKNAITLLVSPATCKSIIEMLNKYIFFADKVEIHDITKKTCFFVLIGPKSDQVMEDLNLGDLVGQPYGTHQHYSVNGMPITVGVGGVLSQGGFSFLLSPAAAGSVWETFQSAGAVPMGTAGWERLRILQAKGLVFMRKDGEEEGGIQMNFVESYEAAACFTGRPAPGKELTNEFNVLEAGLWRAISLNKGCYKGQETISRLITYDGVKQRLWGLNLSDPAEPGSAITIQDKKVGKLTSYSTGRSASEHVGLGYIKKKACTVGDEVKVGNVIGNVVEVPFLLSDSPIKVPDSSHGKS